MIFQENLLESQVALVTGGGTGIGFGIAKELARYGADVAVASRNTDHLDPAVAELGKMGGRAIGVQADVRDPESVSDMVAQTLDRLGRIDVLVNNAAGNFYAPSAGLTPNGGAPWSKPTCSGRFSGARRSTQR